MPRLSIVVFCFERTDLLEETLVAVLQHRPADCEVMVVHDGRYQDPYDLADEVRFLTVDSPTSMARCANIALAQATGLIVHFLASGVVVGPGWAESALGFFDDPDVGAVTPLLRNSQDGSVASFGVRLNRLMNRTMVARGQRPDRSQMSRRTGAVPNLVASFYRRSQLASLGGFRPEFGDELADIDAGLRLKSVGTELINDFDSVLTVGAWDKPPRVSAADRGRLHQRFLQDRLLSAPQRASNRLTYWALSGLNGILEVLTIPRSPGRAATAWARLQQWRQGFSAPSVEAATTLETQPVLSIDSARQKKRALQTNTSASRPAPQRRAA